jgi:glycosyltransferase involved in cell wall biosynthesis
VEGLVSIIVPVYNAEKTVSETINSVISQSYLNWELILVNDGSTDDSDKIVSSFSDSRINYTEQKNKGVAHARNTGLNLARGEFIAFLDSDDLWDSSKLEKSVSYLNSFKSDLVYSKVKMFKDDISNAISYEYVEPIIETNDYYRLLIFDYIPTLSVLLKKSVLDEIGNFDVNLNGTEDWDLWIRIAEKYQINFISDELAFYRISENGLSKNRNLHLREEFKVIQKHVLSSNHLPKRIINLSLWVWNKKMFLNSFKQKKYLLALYYYLRLYLFLPFSRNNIILLLKR